MRKKTWRCWNMCKGTQNCARKSLLRALIFATCSCWPAFAVALADLSPRVASAPPLTLCSSLCRVLRAVPYLRPCSCWRNARHTVECCVSCHIYSPAHADRSDCIGRFSRLLMLTGIYRGLGPTFHHVWHARYARIRGFWAARWAAAYCTNALAHAHRIVCCLAPRWLEC